MAKLEHISTIYKGKNEQGAIDVVCLAQLVELQTGDREVPCSIIVFLCFFLGVFFPLLLFSFCFVDLLMYVLMYVFIYVFIIWERINSFPGSMTIKSHYGFFFSHFAFFISEEKNK